MNDKDEVIQAISIGLIVAYFLLNTNRVLKSIEVCKECLAIFKQKAGIEDDKLARSLCKKVHLIMFNAYRTINGNTKKNLQTYREIEEKLAEYTRRFNLAWIYFCQSKYAKARELYEKALLISTEICDRDGEAQCYLGLGAGY